MADLFDNRAVRPMLIAERSDPFNSQNYIFELKMDGERCLAYLDPLDGVDLRNKSNARLLNHVPELSKINEQVSTRCILDGELIIAVDGAPDFFEIQRRTLTTDKFKIQLQSSRLPATFVAFDILYCNSQETTSLTVMQRKELLQQTVMEENESLVISRFIEERGIDFFNLCVQRNLEGIVAKRKESKYYFGKRTKDWIKVKNLQSDDFVVCGYYPSEGRMTTVILGQYREGVLNYKGNVQVGTSSENFALISEVPRSQSPTLLSLSTDVIWLFPLLVCSVRYMTQTPSGSMRQPVFQGLRLDVEPEECISPP